MSTKINLRSPFYLKYSEPSLPSVALDCATINLQNLSIDEYGNISLPSSDYGQIVSYTSSAGDFTDGKFAAVGTNTSRTIAFTMSIPENFSNSGDDTINCNATATQPATACTGGISNNGSIPNQSLNTGGNSVTIDLSSYFTGGTVTSYLITNNNLDYFETSLDTNTLSIFSKEKAGTNKKLLVEASDGNAANCKATQTIQVTTTATSAWTSADAYLSGGSITQAGVITNPTVNGTITAIKDSSGGSTITSYPANSTGSDRSVTLYFNVTVPTGYSNTGATVEVSKAFTQPTAALPTFTCSIASLSNQAIYTSGTIVKGLADKGTITGFSPLNFNAVSTDTSRSVTYTVTPPGSGYSNSGGSDISCAITLTQPAMKPTAGDKQHYYAGWNYSFLTNAQAAASYPSVNPAITEVSLEAVLASRGLNSVAPLNRTQFPCVLQNNNWYGNVNTYVYDGEYGKTLRLRTFRSASSLGIATIENPTGGIYVRVSKTRENSNVRVVDMPTAYYMKFELTGLVSEIWLVNHLIPTFTKIA